MLNLLRNPKLKAHENTCNYLTHTLTFSPLLRSKSTIKPASISENITRLRIIGKVRWRKSVHRNCRCNVSVTVARLVRHVLARLAARVRAVLPVRRRAPPTVKPPSCELQTSRVCGKPFFVLDDCWWWGLWFVWKMGGFMFLCFGFEMVVFYEGFCLCM